MTNGKWQMANGKWPRVAIVHDWLIGGGAERVVLELHRMFPDAPIYTSYCADEWRQKLGGKVVTGYLQHWPLGRLRKFIPFLRAWWFSRLNLSSFDLVISSSGAEAKFIRQNNGKWQMINTKYQMANDKWQMINDKAIHIAYIHAPTHYYWSRYEQYIKSPGFGLFDPLARLGLKLLVSPMRRWDYRAAQRPDTLIANSTHTKEMIKKYYNRDSLVIYPPVDTAQFGKWKMVNGKSTNRHGFVVIGRQTSYKRIDLAVAACTKLGLPLTVIGNGPEHKKLVKMAGPTITFVTDATDDDVVRYLQSAKAFIFPGLDDFGIAAVEALAAGTPVIAYKAGGALDYIIPGKTGEFFPEQTTELLCNTLKKFNPTTYKEVELVRMASSFSQANFQKRIIKIINELKR